MESISSRSTSVCLTSTGSSLSKAAEASGAGTHRDPVKQFPRAWYYPAGDAKRANGCLLKNISLRQPREVIFQALGGSIVFSDDVGKVFSRPLIPL
jgi:hypothetical protein